MTFAAERRYLGGGAAHGHGSVQQTRPRRLVDVTVTRRGAGTQTSQHLLHTQHDLIATLRLRRDSGAGVKCWITESKSLALKAKGTVSITKQLPR